MMFTEECKEWLMASVENAMMTKQKWNLFTPNTQANPSFSI